jgi:DNA-binding winged helix-turn-helix (wHTH) protein
LEAVKQGDQLYGIERCEYDKDGQQKKQKVDVKMALKRYSCLEILCERKK